MEEKSERLDVQDEVILSLYRLLYEEDYDCTHEKKGSVNPVHLNAQKAEYIFSELMIPVGEYGFCWNHYGPYSEELQNRLHALDQKKELVKDYYDHFHGNENEYLHSLFSSGQTQRIKNASDALRELAQSRDGSELLGSLIYLGRTVLPGREFESVNSQLRLRKEHFTDDSFNKKAWDKLAALKLVSQK